VEFTLQRITRDALSSLARVISLTMSNGIENMDIGRPAIEIAEAPMEKADMALTGEASAADAGEASAADAGDACADACSEVAPDDAGAWS
jgi:hypothetical protein